jgi:hypothetical protein
MGAAIPLVWARQTNGRWFLKRKPLAFKQTLTIPQPTACTALAKGYDGKCPCCRRKFSEG